MRKPSHFIHTIDFNSNPTSKLRCRNIKIIIHFMTSRSQRPILTYKDEEICTRKIIWFCSICDLQYSHFCPCSTSLTSSLGLQQGKSIEPIEEAFSSLTGTGHLTGKGNTEAWKLRTTLGFRDFDLQFLPQ